MNISIEETQNIVDKYKSEFWFDRIILHPDYLKWLVDNGCVLEKKLCSVFSVSDVEVIESAMMEYGKIFLFQGNNFVGMIIPEDERRWKVIKWGCRTPLKSVWSVGM